VRVGGGCWGRWEAGVGAGKAALPGCADGYDELFALLEEVVVVGAVVVEVGCSCVEGVTPWALLATMGASL